MNRVNQVVIKRVNYNNDGEYELAIASQLQNLTKGGYVCTLGRELEDKHEVTIIDYSFNHPDNPSEPLPFWLTQEEFDSAFITHKMNNMTRLRNELKQQEDELREMGFNPNFPPKDPDPDKGNGGFDA